MAASFRVARSVREATRPNRVRSSVPRAGLLAAVSHACRMARKPSQPVMVDVAQFASIEDALARIPAADDPCDEVGLRGATRLGLQA